MQKAKIVQTQSVALAKQNGSALHTVVVVFGRYADLFLLILQAGDADTNGAVAGALLGCKLGASELPDSWRDGLKHKDWLDGHISK